MKELVLSELEKLELKKLQDEYTEVSKTKNSLKRRIDSFINQHTVSIFQEKSITGLLNRDLDAVYEYLKIVKEAETKHICNFLNTKLEGLEVRWNRQNFNNIKLDSGMFYNFLATYMKNDTRFYKEDKLWKVN